MINDIMLKVDFVFFFMVYLFIQLVVSGLIVILEVIVLCVYFFSEFMMENFEKCKVEFIDLDLE